MGIFEFLKKRTQEESVGNIPGGIELIETLVDPDLMNIDKAMNIPTFSGCVSRICDTVSLIPIYLYEKDGNSVKRVDDERTGLINKDTHDTLTGPEFKISLVFDYLTNKGGYAYINRKGTKIVSVNYVEADEISFLTNTDPIFKDYKIRCGSGSYEGYDFLKILRHTKNGYRGNSIISENKEALSTAYNSLMLENSSAKNHGIKKGFLQSPHKLDESAYNKLKTAFNRLYTDKNKNFMILQDGLKFVEASETSTEMQANENKKSNATEICKLFGMPTSILCGGATEQDKLNYIQYAIVPILEEICASLNRDLLFESEKKNRFFTYDITELTKGDIKTRFEAYSTAYKTGFMQIDDIRKRENMPSLGIPFIKLGLQDVLYNPITGAIFTPNMGKGYNIKDAMDGKADFDSEGNPQGTASVEESSDQKKVNVQSSGKEKNFEGNNKS